MNRHVMNLLTLSATVVAPIVAWGQPPTPKREDISKVDRTSDLEVRKINPKFTALFKPSLVKVTPSIVTVFNDTKEAALGTIVSEDGFILTKASQLKDGPIKVTLSDKKNYDAKLIVANVYHDLALLKIPASHLTPVTLTDSNVASVGSWVAAAMPNGSPADVGVIGVAARSFKAPYGRTLPEEQAGMLGIRMEDISNGIVRITEVTSGGAASKAGIQAKDVLVKIEQHRIDGLEAAQNILRRLRAGETVAVTVERDKKLEVINVTLGNRPAPKRKGGFGRDQNQMGSELSEHRDGFPTVLQHDLVLKPTECGGPLVDLDGRVVGINIARAGRVETYALPAETIKQLLPDMMAPQPVGLASHIVKASKIKPKTDGTESNVSTPATNNQGPMPREVKK